MIQRKKSFKVLPNYVISKNAHSCVLLFSLDNREPSRLIQMPRKLYLYN